MIDVRRLVQWLVCTPAEGAPFRLAYLLSAGRTHSRGDLVETLNAEAPLGAIADGRLLLDVLETQPRCSLWADWGAGAVELLRGSVLEVERHRKAGTVSFVVHDDRHRLLQEGDFWWPAGTRATAALGEVLAAAGLGVGQMDGPDVALPAYAPSGVLADAVLAILEHGLALGAGGYLLDVRPDPGSAGSLADVVLAGGNADVYRFEEGATLLDGSEHLSWVEVRQGVLVLGSAPAEGGRAPVVARVGQTTGTALVGIVSPSGGGSTAGSAAGSATAAGGTDPESWTRSEAARLGVDPDEAVRVARAEGGLASWNAPGDVNQSGVPTSFGPFQLHYGGLGARGDPNNVGGLGDDFTSTTGKDARDASAGPAAVTFALENVAAHGWGAFHGAAVAGVGVGGAVGASRAQAAAPVKTTQVQGPAWASEAEAEAAGEQWLKAHSSPTRELTLIVPDAPPIRKGWTIRGPLGDTLELLSVTGVQRDLRAGIATLSVDASGSVDYQAQQLVAADAQRLSGASGGTGSGAALSDVRLAILERARAWLGSPYVLGAKGGSPGSAVDCSGLTAAVFAEVGLSLPGGTMNQEPYCIVTGSPKGGDLVFFRRQSADPAERGHVGILLEDTSRMISAYAPGIGVIESAVSSVCCETSRRRHPQVPA